jgi:hydroxymethylbilane synthase
MAKLAVGGIASTILHVSTKGDRVQDRSLDALDADGVFVKELEAALRERHADYAVHSCKDLPSILPEDMLLAAIGAREDPRDAFCSEHHASFDALPKGSVVGTSSPRRKAQLQALRPDLRYAVIRGNVDTRLRKLREGSYDAIILAMAGLNRLGLRARHTVPLDTEMIIPAAGQGALAVECRADDRDLAAALHTALTDPHTEIAVRAERAFLRRLHAGCQAPVGAYATYDGKTLTLHGVIAESDGSRVIRASKSAKPAMTRAQKEPHAESIGEELAAELLSQGGAEILAFDEQSPLRGILILLPRTQDRVGKIAPALRGIGASVIEVAGGEEAMKLTEDRDPDLLLFPSSGSVPAIASYLVHLRTRRTRLIVAAMGEASASAATAHGFPPHIVAPEPSIPMLLQSVTEYLLREKSRHAYP